MTTEQPWLLPHCHNCEAFNLPLEPYRGKLWCHDCRVGHEELVAMTWGPLICERCGQRLDEAKAVWLELSWRTNRWYPPHQCPPEESQGHFSFGKDCAAKVLKQQK